MSEPARNGNGRLDLTTLIAIAGVLGAGVNWVLRPSDAQFESIRRELDDAKADRGQLDARLTRMWEAEQQRNNGIEAKLAAASAVDQLFMAGKLRLDP